MTKEEIFFLFSEKNEKVSKKALLKYCRRMGFKYRESHHEKLLQLYKVEKNARRVSTLLRKNPEYSKIFYTSTYSLDSTLELLNSKYSSIITEDEVYLAVHEIERFIEILKNGTIEDVLSFSLVNLKSLYLKMGFTDLSYFKTFSRFQNCKKILSIHQSKIQNFNVIEEINKERIAQLEHFVFILGKLKDATKENIYTIALRFDFKTLTYKEYTTS